MRDRMITVDQAAEIMQLSRETVYAMIKRGQLPFIQIGKRTWRCSLSNLYEYLGLQANFDDEDDE